MPSLAENLLRWLWSTKQGREGNFETYEMQKE